MDYPHTDFAAVRLGDAKVEHIVGAHAVPALSTMHGRKSGRTFLNEIEGSAVGPGCRQRPVAMLKRVLEECGAPSTMQHDARDPGLTAMLIDDVNLLPCCHCGRHVREDNKYGSDSTSVADDCALCGHTFAASDLAPTASSPVVDLCELCMELFLLITVVRSLKPDDPRRSILKKQLQVLVDWLTTSIDGLYDLQEWI